MISSFDSKNEATSGVFNCTTASTFEKLNSLKFELLFGEYRGKVEKKDGNGDLVNAVDYMFEPNQIFGFACESTGANFNRMHHTFILRSCMPGEVGVIIAGISPGAQVLAKTLTHTGSRKLRDIINKLSQSGVHLCKMPTGQYRRINNLLEIKASSDFLVSELVAQQANR